MPSCKKCHASLDDETILCPVCGRVNADADPKTADAQAQLAHAFLWGDKGLRPDSVKAKLWAERAAEQGSPDGVLVLHKCLMDESLALGDETMEILDEAVVSKVERMLVEAADRWDERPPKLFEPSFLHIIAGAALLHKEPEKGFASFLKAAELGDPRAMREVGIFYLKGIGVEENTKAAIDWLIKAIAGGDMDAFASLGETLVEDGPKSPDFRRGVECLERASAAGVRHARGTLGLLLRFGDGVKKDLKRAINLMSDAAEDGNPAMQHCLGVLLWNGEDNVKPNLPVARKWMALAAEKDFEDSKELLAKIDDAIALKDLGITQEELDRPNEPPPPAEEPAVPLSEADALRRENESLHAEVKRLRDLSEKYRSQLLAYTSRMNAEKKEKLAALDQTKGELFKAARSRSSDPTAYVNLAKYFESAFGSNIAFTERAYKSLEECTSDLHLVWTALYNLATVLHRLLKVLPPAEAYKRFQEKAGQGLEIARGNGKMTHANNALMANYRDTYDGKEIDVEAHVEKGSDPKSPKFLRLYFGYDPKVVDKIVVSHVGSHLPNYQTLTKVGGW